MSSVVFILGAGASRECGGPLMGDFLDIARNLLLTNRVEDKGSDFRRVFQTIGHLQRVHSKAQLDLANIESVFTALELGNIIRSVPGVAAEEIPATIAALKVLIVKTLESRIKFPRSAGMLDAPVPYPAFAASLKKIQEDLNPRRDVSIITFNYDLAIDVALYRAGLGPNYVIGDSSSANREIELMKLHGSLNWVCETESKAIRPFPLSKFFQRHKQSFGSDSSLARLPLSSFLVEYFHEFEKIAVDPQPVIVPPSWNKSDYHQTLSKVWARAAEHLSNAEYIFVIGYSLPPTDSFFRHLYALGSVGDQPLQCIAVFDTEPIRGRVNRRFERLLGPGALARFRYYPLAFSKAPIAIEDILTAGDERPATSAAAR